MAAFVTKEELVQDILDKGDRAKNLNRLIEVMERMKIAYFREIVCWLLNFFEERQSVKFTPEALRYLHQEIIEGHQEGSKRPVENSDEDVKSIMEKQGHAGIQSRQPQWNDDFLPTVVNEAKLIRHKLLQIIPPREIWEQTKTPLKLTTGSKLGQGSFGIVIQGAAYVAMKIPKDQRGQSYLMNEIRILRWLKHENIVAFLGTCSKSEALVMERMDENLHQHIKQKNGSLRIHSIMRFGLDVAYGLEYLQQLGILHLDLKSKNILINDNPEIAKLSDFGLAKVLTQDNVAREVLHYDGQSYDSNSIFPQSLKTDIWNTGWVIFEMVICRSPDLGELSRLVKQSNGRFPDLDDLVTKCTREIVPVPGGRREVFQKFPDLKELVTNCIQFFPASRPTIFQVINILKEYFMSP